jgi:hypothetical protein
MSARSSHWLCLQAAYNRRLPLQPVVSERVSENCPVVVKKVCVAGILEYSAAPQSSTQRETICCYTSGTASGVSRRYDSNTDRPCAGGFRGYVYNKERLSRSWASIFGTVPKELPSKVQKVRRYSLGTKALNGYSDAIGVP